MECGTSRRPSKCHEGHFPRVHRSLQLSGTRSYERSSTTGTGAAPTIGAKEMYFTTGAGAACHAGAGVMHSTTGAGALRKMERCSQRLVPERHTLRALQAQAHCIHRQENPTGADEMYSTTTAGPAQDSAGVRCSTTARYSTTGNSTLWPRGGRLVSLATRPHHAMATHA